MIPRQLSKFTEPLYLRAHTAAGMEPRQLAGIVERKSREFFLPRLTVDFDRLYERRVPDDPAVHLDAIAENIATLRACIDEQTRSGYRDRARSAADGTPDFLNRTLRIADGADVNWYDERFETLPLWRMKLYAFQPLSWLCRGFEPKTTNVSELRSTFDGWIENWMESVVIGDRNYLRYAWTPWAVSLRIISWSRYLGWRRECGGRDTTEFERSFRRELYKNALFLENHVERDVGGNHLIENGAALVVAGLLFEERSWVDTGKSILSEAATEQFLDDGCHFERSPMYHVLTVTRYLTVCDLLDRSGRPVPAELRWVAERATEFLEYLRPPNGHIPLLNDSVYGQALPLDSCLEYAAALGFDGSPGQSTASGGAEPLGESGYRWLRAEGGAMLVDGGPVGPPHLPGHSHSDTLGVLLWLDDQPIITDTGTFGYESGYYRQYARGVRGHSTVQVGDTEPIALGGKYLMGPRPEPTTRFRNGTVSVFEGKYRAKPVGGSAYTHRRAVFTGEDWWVVRDSVGGHDNRVVRSSLHLHPDVVPSIEPTGRIRLDTGGETRAFVYGLESAGSTVTTGQYFPRFGVATSRSVIELHADVARSDPATFGFLVTQRDLPVDAVETTSEGSSLTHLRLAEDTHRLPTESLTTE